MAAQYKTQCPHCQAQFRISEEHLKQAKGQVRCGSCLKVFLATEHLVGAPVAAKPAAKPAAPAPKPAPRPAPKAAAKPAPAPAAKPAAKAAPPAAAPTPAAAPPEKWSLPDADSKPAAPASRWTLNEDGDSAEDSFDEHDDFAEEEIPEARPPANDTKVSLGAIELSDSFMSLDEDDDERLRDEDFSDMAGAGRKSDNQGHDSDESWAEKLLEELDDRGTPETPVSADNLSLDETEEESQRREARQQKKQKRETRAQKKTGMLDDADWAQDAGTGLFEEDGFGFLEDAGDEVTAIELPQAEKKKVTPNIRLDAMVASGAELLRWGAMSALMIALFGLQYLSFNFDTLARTPEWRGFYTTVCSAFACVLPSASDLDKLRGANLVVRKHPAYSNALVVDVLLFNQASYEQPYPVLELGFTTLQGAAVASRRFVPGEYLSSELANSNAMPIDTPVHISLEILDPGEEAVNYTLRFLPAPQNNDA